MPTKRERELIMSYYFKGFQDGLKASQATKPSEVPLSPFERERPRRDYFGEPTNPKYKPYSFADVIAPKKRKLSAWNKYVKNKRNHIKYRDGKLNLKKMAVAFRRKRRR